MSQLQLHSAFISSALWNPLQTCQIENSHEVRAMLARHAHFLAAGPLHPEAEPDPLAVLLANLLRRGLPTLPSLRVEQALAERTGLTRFEMAGRSADTRSWEARLTEPLSNLLPWLEAAMEPVEEDFEPGPAPGFSLPGFDSSGEEQFYFGPLRDVLGPAWPLVERQRPLESMVDDRRFFLQRADFCLEFPGVKADEARGAVIEFDGAHHDSRSGHGVEGSRQARLDKERDAACRQAGWIVIRVPAQDAGALAAHPDLLKLLQHPRMQGLQKQVRNPLGAQEPGRRVLELVWLPIGVARLQAVVAQALLAGRLSLDDERWRVAVIERDLACADLAFQDLRDWIQALLHLYRPGRTAPRIELTALSASDLDALEAARLESAERPFQLLIDQALFATSGSRARPLPHLQADMRVTVRSGYRPLERRELATTPRPLPRLPLDVGDSLDFFLQNLFRKGAFREKQREIVLRALRRESTIALLPTGAGKSLTYQLSALLTNGVALVVDPIKSLMKDQVDNLALVGIDCTAYINSTMSGKARQQAGQDLADGRVKFTFVSPERLLIEDFRVKLRAMQRVRFCFAVVDEAHCVSEWGHDFRTAYLRLGENLRRFCPADLEGQQVPVLALTGTASHEVLGDVQRELQLDGGDDEIVKPERMARDELVFQVQPLEHFPDLPKNASQQKISMAVGRARQELLVDALADIAATCEIDGRSGRMFSEFVDPERADHGSGLVFCPHVSWVHGVEEVSRFLAAQFPDLEERIDIYAGRLADTLGSERLLETQDKFKQGRVTVLVCTKAFGMGIDKADIRFTVHVNLPQSLEAFYQEAGRAGRDRQTAHCRILYAGAPEAGQPSVDLGLMESFHREAFRGQEQELAKIFDLLDRVRIPGLRGIDQAGAELNADAEVPVRCNLWKMPNPSRLYVNDLFSGEKLAWLALPGLEIRDAAGSGPNGLASVQGLVERIQRACPDPKTRIEWLQTRSQPVDGPGLEALLAGMPEGGRERLVDIPFDNGIADDLALFLAKKQAGWTKEIIESAYSFTYEEDDFLARMAWLFEKATGDRAMLTGAADELARRAFRILRSESQTFRTVYRLSTLGVIDDYTLDYNARVITIRLRRMVEGGITRALQRYMARYIYVNDVVAVPAEVEAVDEFTELRRAASRLVRFVYERIAARRREALQTMDDTTRVGVKDPRQFTDALYSYFDSRYTDILRKYLREYEFETPIDVLEGKDFSITPHDVNHLLGSCNRLLAENPENAALLVLRAVCFALIRAYDERDVQRVLRDGLTAYRRRADATPIKVLLLLERLVGILKRTDTERAGPFEAEIAHYHTDWMREFLRDLKVEVRHDQAN
jgi:superfamily II DNA helicase RecQ